MPAPNESLMALGACVDSTGSALALRATNLGPGPAGNAPWTVSHVPNANTQAVATKAAAAAGVKHVCTGVTATIAAGSTAPAATHVYVYLRDGASGSGTILWAGVLAITATAGDRSGVARSGLWIEGTAATAMVLEFAAAGGANTYEAVTLEGVDL